MSPINAETWGGFQTAFFRSIIVGFAMAMLLEFGWLGSNVPIPVLFAIPVGFGLACGVAVAWINRLWGARGVVMAGWTTAFMYAGLILANLLVRCFNLWSIGFIIFPASMPLMGAFGFVLGWRRVRAGRLEIPES